MMHRREFFRSALLLLLFLPARPSIGAIRFCRVSHPRWLKFVPPGCIAEVDSAAEGITFLGVRATLAVNRAGCHVFPASEV
jgi:hypothetical protein